jgi:hypothetical protein
MIAMQQAMVSGSRTSNKGSRWRAVTMIDGVPYEAESRSGAPFALARVLVAAGVGDQPVQTIGADGVVRMPWRSLHWMAGRTIQESATFPVREVGYTERPKSLSGEPQYRGISEGGATSPPEAMPEAAE